ncbi:PE-PPE domain-containing protein [Williamsia sp. M5A3_1d]
MKRLVRTVGLALVALAATVLLALQTVLGASAGANTLLVMGGNDNGSGADMDKKLSGYFSGEPDSAYPGYTFTKVPWTATSGGVSLLFGGKTYDDSQADGLAKITAALTDTLEKDAEGQIVIVGYSSSANVVTKLVRKLTAEGSPNADRVGFLVFGNPNRPNGGLLGRFAGTQIPFPFGITFDGESSPSAYQVTDIAWQYDGYADFPNDTRNLLAVVNAVIGIVTLHGFYDGADPSNPDNIVSDYTDGNTRYVTLKSSLPLLAGLYGLGIPPQLLTGLDSFLRSEIEKAYDRTVPQVATVTAARQVASVSETPTSSTTTSTAAKAKKATPPESEDETATTPSTTTSTSPSSTSERSTTTTKTSGASTSTSGSSTTSPDASAPSTSGTPGADPSTTADTTDESSSTRTVAPAA